VVNPTTGAFTYTPTQAQRQAATGSTTDTFTITATNGVNTATRTVTVGVDAGHPVPGDATVGAPSGDTGMATGSVAFTDTAGRTLTYSSTGTSTGGGAVAVDAATGAFTYTPTQAQRQAATGSTTDTFTITADNGVNTAAKTVTVSVAKAANAASKPVAGALVVGTAEAGAGAIEGSVAFTDPSGKTLTYSASETSTGGGTILFNDGAFVYTPTQAQRLAATKTTTDTFTVTADNGTDTTTTTITVAVRPLTITPIDPPPSLGVEVGGGLIGDGTYYEFAIAFSPNGSRAYVTDQGNVWVSVIDTSTKTRVGDPITVLRLPAGLAVNPAGTRLYVAEGGGRLTVIDTTTQSVVASVSITNAGRGVVVSPDGQYVYVSGGSGRDGQIGNVFVINATTNTLTTTIQIPNSDGNFQNSTPCSIVFSPDGKKAYVTNYKGSVSVIDTDPTSPNFNKVIGYPFAVPGAYGIVLGAGGTVAYLPEMFNTGLNVLDTRTGAQTSIDVGSDSLFEDVAVNKDGTRAYLSDAGQGYTGRIIVVDTDPASPFYQQVIGTLSFDENTQAYPVGRIQVNDNGDVYFIAQSLDGTGTTVSVVS
jgi:YVTN family beta-propeller protein/VCBS repeat-containing protein